jgi:hypothetical protein
VTFFLGPVQFVGNPCALRVVLLLLVNQVSTCNNVKPEIKSMLFEDTNNKNNKECVINYSNVESSLTGGTYIEQEEEDERQEFVFTASTFFKHK